MRSGRIRRSRWAERSGRWSVHLVRGGLIAAAILIGLIASFAVVGPHFGYSYAVVKSGSMAPAYPPGSVILIGETSPRSVRAGDVISYRAPSQTSSQIITHRVVEVRESSGGLQFVTRGDANQSIDTRAVEASELKGRVLFGVPWIGRLAALLQQQGLFFGIVLVCAVLIVAGEVRNIAREVRRARLQRREQPPVATPWVPPWAAGAPSPQSGGASAVLGARWVRAGVISGLLALVLFWSMPHVSAQFTDSDSTTSNAIRMRTYPTLVLEVPGTSLAGVHFSLSPTIDANPPEPGCATFSIAPGGDRECPFALLDEPYTLTLAPVVTPANDWAWQVDGACALVEPVTDPATATVTITTVETATCTISIIAIIE